jgi:putative transposase
MMGLHRLRRRRLVRQCRYFLHDRDAKFCAPFQEVFDSEGIRCLRLPPRSPNLNAFAERWVRSVKEEGLFKLILFGERTLHRAVTGNPRRIWRPGSAGRNQ